MAEKPKLVMMGDSSSSSSLPDPPLCSPEMGFREMGVQKIAFSDQLESPKTETSHSFLVDIESLSHAMDKDITENSSRISVKLQRNLSRKGSIRGEGNKSNLVPNAGIAQASPKASSTEGSTPRKTGMAPLVSPRAKDEPISTLSEQIVKFTAESRCRRFCKNRNYAWFMDPRRVLLFFATLSSMGTILLIYFTLSISKLSGDDNIHTQ